PGPAKAATEEVTALPRLQPFTPPTAPTAGPCSPPRSRKLVGELPAGVHADRDALHRLALRQLAHELLPHGRQQRAGDDGVHVAGTALHLLAARRDCRDHGLVVLERRPVVGL